MIIAALPTPGRSITPATENIIPPLLVTILTATGGNVPFYLSCTPIRSTVALPSEDRIAPIPIGIVRRGTLASSVRRLPFRLRRSTPENRFSTRFEVTLTTPAIRPLDLAHYSLPDP